jgi:hypothetical protein
VKLSASTAAPRRSRSWMVTDCMTHSSLID